MLMSQRSTALAPFLLRDDIDLARPALVGPDGAALDHAELRRRVRDVVRTLPDSRHGALLAQVRLAPTIDDVIAYLGLLEAGHVPLLVPPGGGESLREAWPPDLVVEGGRFHELGDGEPRHLLHPELRLLLSTSGSTGSPKLVRLSGDNLLANADAIARALRLTEDDRGITSLPLHYTFGLSVIHSHLRVGASVVLTGDSVLAPGFWDLVDDGVTNLAVVPHMVELMETTGVLDRPHPSLRLVTQAGGRMAPERVVRTAALGSRHGWGLSVMYGQSEATARIAVQPPELTAQHPDTVGWPVADTDVVIDTDVPEADPAAGTGEIVVRGPGVMLGYAEHPDDLALGRMVDELRTGDLGTVTDTGLLRIVGRRAGFVKVLGLRIDLARVERALEQEGFSACVTGDDSALRVVVEPGLEHGPALAARVRELAGRASGVGPGNVHVLVHRIPRLPNGKVDRVGCDALVVAQDVPQPSGDSPGLRVRVATAVRDVLGRDEVDLGRSFVGQGGDSLCHVRASTTLGEILGPLPADWHHRPLEDLVAAAESVPPRDVKPARRGWVAIETSVLIRAIAVVIICGSHAEIFRLLGGAHTLMVVAGFNAALFGLSLPGVGERWRGTARFVVGIGIPTMVVAAVGMAFGRYGWGNVLLAHWAFGDWGRLQRNELWFVDALILCVLVATAALSHPRLAALWRRDPWRVAFGMALVGLVPRYVILGLFEGHLRGLMPTVFWLFAVGLALAHARSARQRFWTLAVAAAGVIGYFPDDPARNATIMLGILALGLLQRVRIPRLLLPVVTLLAAASLHIYLIQFLVLSWIDSDLLGTMAALAAGVLLWKLTAAPVARLQKLIPLTNSGAERPHAGAHLERTNP